MTSCFLLDVNSAQIFVGDIKDSLNQKFIRDNQIKAIVDCIDVFHRIEGVSYLVISGLHDSLDAKINDFFDYTIAFIDYHVRTLKQNVLIHCHKGKSRSVTMLIAYYKYLYTIRDVKEKVQITVENQEEQIIRTLNYIKQFRPLANPNPSFITQVIVWSPTNITHLSNVISEHPIGSVLTLFKRELSRHEIQCIMEDTQNNITDSTTVELKETSN